MSIKKGKFRILSDTELLFFCEGCKRYHSINIDKNKSPSWDFNGDYNNPTISPSIFITDPGKICHSYIKNGKIRYLSDSYHELKNQAIKMRNEEEII